MASPREILNQLLFYDETNAALDKIVYGYDAEGEPNFTQLFNGLPFWPQSIPQPAKKKKKIIITDWSIKYAIESFETTRELWDVFLKEGAELYVWTGELTPVSTLNEMQEALHKVEDIHANDLIEKLKKQNITADSCEIIDYTYAKELTLELLKPLDVFTINFNLQSFAHLNPALIQRLWKTLTFSKKLLLDVRELENILLLQTIFSTQQSSIDGLIVDNEIFKTLYKLNQIPPTAINFMHENSEHDILFLDHSQNATKFLTLFTAPPDELGSEILETFILQTTLPEKKLVTILKKNPNLKTLRFCSPEAKPEDQPADFKENKLTTLSVCGVPYSTHFINQFLMHSPHLISLELEWLDSELKFDDLPQGFEFKALRHLYLNYVDITEFQLDELLKRCPQLTSLDIEDCPKISMQKIKKLREKYFPGKLNLTVDINKLDLQNIEVDTLTISLLACELNFQQLQFLIQKYPKLTELHEISFKEELSYSQSFPSIQKIRLNNISNSTLQLRALACFPNLEVISFTHNQFDQDAPDHDARIIFELKQVRILDLEACLWSENKILNLIQNCPNTKILKLPLGLSKNFFKKLAALNLTQLYELNCGRSEITDESFIKILNANPDINYFNIISCVNITENFLKGLLPDKLKQLKKFEASMPIAKKIKEFFPDIEIILPAEDSNTAQKSKQSTLHFDTQTTTSSEKVVHPQQYFKYKNAEKKFPAVNNYRLSAENLSINKRIIYQARHLQLTAVNLPNLAHINLEALYDKEYANREDVFYGELTIALEKDYWTRLPSLTAMDKLLEINADAEIEIAYDSKDNFYYVRAKAQLIKPTRITFNLQTEYKNILKVLPAAENETLHLFKNLKFDADGKIIPSAALQQILNMNLKQRISNLIAYCQTFHDVKSDVHYEDDIQRLNHLIARTAGSCRHRSRVFDALAGALGIQANIITNDCHEFVEIELNNIKYNVDLGGAPVVVKPKPITHAQASASNLTPHQIPTLTPKNRFVTWNSAQSNATTFEKYFYDIEQDAAKLPAHKRNVVVIVENDLQVEAFHQALNSHLSKAKRTLVYAQALGDISEFSGHVSQTGELTKQPSQLFTEVSELKNGVMVANYSDYQPRYIGFNSMTDEERKIKNLNIPDDTLMISLITKKQAAQMGEDFYSRHPIKSQCIPLPFNDIKNKLMQPVSLLGCETISFFDANWQRKLLGAISIDSDRFSLQSSELLDAINKPAAGCILENAPWHLVEFRLFMTELIEKRWFYHNGEKKFLPENFYFHAQDKQYDLENEYLQVVASYPHQAFDLILNTQSFNKFSKDFHAENKQLLSLPGWCEAHANQTLKILVTEKLSNAQWAELIKQAKLHHCQLQLTFSAGLEAPKAFKKIIPEKILSQSVLPNKIILTNDLDITTDNEFAKQSDAVVISVNEHTRFSDLISAIKTTHRKDDKYEFAYESGFLQELLLKKSHIILKGNLSNLLSKQLESIFLANPYLFVNGEKQNVLAQVTLISTHTTIASCENIVTEKHTPQGAWTILDKKFNDKEAYIKTLYTDFKAACEQIQNETNIQFSYCQLKQMTNKLAKGMVSNPFKPFFRLYEDKHLLHVSKKHWDRKRPKPLFETIEEKRHNKIITELEYSPYVFIAGPSGIGKSTYVLEQLAQEPSTKVFVGLEKLKEWASADPVDFKAILFIDEANLEKEGAWDIFEGLFNPTPGIIIDKVFYPLKENHKIVFAGNFNHFKGRQEHEFFKRHGNVFSFKELADFSLSKKNIMPYLTNKLDEKFHDLVIQKFLTAYHQLNDALPNHPLTARNLKMMSMRFIQHLKNNSLALNEASVTEIATLAVIDEVEELLTPKLKKEWGVPLKIAVELNQQQPKELGKFNMTESRQPIVRLLNTHLALREQQSDAISQIILEGPPGVGKSLLAIECLKAQGFVDGKEVSEGDKRYYHITPTDPEKMTALLVKAFHEGAVVVIDELNSLVLERVLNHLLSGVDLEGKKALKQGFLIIGTQNPISMKGRSALSMPLENRSRKIEVPDYTEQELKEICFKLFPNEMVTELIAEYLEAKAYAKHFNHSPAPTPRDLFTQIMIEKKLFESQQPASKANISL